MDRVDRLEMRVAKAEAAARRNADNVKELLGIIKDGQKIAKTQNELHKELAHRVDLHDDRLNTLARGCARGRS